MALSPRALLCAGALTAALLVPTQRAHAGEYRQLTLADGRMIYAEILATESGGLRVRTPQGVNMVAFEVLSDMLPIEESKYGTQEDWTIYLTGSEDLTGPIGEAYQALPNVNVHGVAESTRIDAVLATALDACEGDLSCISEKSEENEAPWFWVVSVEQSEEGDATLVGSISQSTRTRNETTASSLAREALYAPLVEAIGMVPDDKPPKGFLETSGGRPARMPVEMTRERVVGLSFAPVPGLPSLMQKDYANFGLAIGTVVPATALWVGAVGKNAQNGGEFVALGVGGFYAATVAVNQVLGLNSYNRGKTVVQVEPARRGEGATVAVTVPLR